MFNNELVIKIVEKIEFAIDRILSSSAEILSPQYYVRSLSGMERLESTCLLLMAIGESVKGIDKITRGKLLVLYPDIDWKGVMGMRDIIAHHYFDIDVETVYDVIKNELPALRETVAQIKKHCLSL